MKDAPLRETALLLAGMAVLALPLAWVTADEPRPASVGIPAEVDGETSGIRTDVELESTGELQWLELRRQTGGELLGRFEGPSRFGSFECQLPAREGGFMVAAKWTDDSTRNAVKVELWPDRREIRSETFWGQGELRTLWEVSWDE